MKKLITFAIAVLCSCIAHADSDSLLPSESSTEQVGNSFMLKIGSAHRADTYLSPIHYDGIGTGLGYSHVRALNDSPLLWELNVGLDIDRTRNKVRNASMLGAQFEARWSMVNRWRVAHPVEIGVGGATTLDAGALYLSRNGNNPVAANASWTVDATAYASATFRIGKLPVVARYTAVLPVVGAMFAPDYGQLYYEIYLGDHRGLFTGAWWGRYFRLDQFLTVDLRLGSKWLRIGYGCDILSTKVHGIVSQRINHNFVLGITIGSPAYTSK